VSVETLSVSQLLTLAKQVLEDGTGPVWVEGELTGFKRHQPSGHLYFDMKDARGRISCVMWRDAAKRLRFDPADGIQVRAHGRLGIYEVQGRLQLYADALEPAGLGALQAALEALKQRLAEDGLFAAERKRALPRYPHRIGVVTSGSGAAWRDVLRVLGERWPIAEVVFRPCAVQGAEAAGQIVDALEDIQQEPGLDLVLLVRGGGSIEDLWCFNEEIVVRAVAGCSLPIVTGVGHEIDVTLVDFASDLRAATPSQAAEFATPSQQDVLLQLNGQHARIRQRAEGRLRTARLALARLEGSHGLRRPVELVRQRAQRIDDLGGRMRVAITTALDTRSRRLADLTARWRARDPVTNLRRSRERLAELEMRLGLGVERRVRQARERLTSRAAHLEAIGPRAVLGRGYAICLRPVDGRAVRTWEDVGTGEEVRVILSEGQLGCRVEQREEVWE
jgi:exodeoxyribonuclease VII large subunit